MIELSSYFATLDDVLAATADLGDGSILISLPIGLGGGAVQVLDTAVADLSAINVNVVCFTAGTFILTPEGEKPIETLVVGDQVLTYNGQAKPLRAINVRRLGLKELHDRPNLWPVVLSEGTLGSNVPSKRLRVSPQHRILVNSKISGKMVGGSALVPAKKLLDLPSITQVRPRAACTYIHLVFEEHEVIRANGCWSESF